MPEPTLHPGETTLADWRPSFGLYLSKITFVGLITALLLGGFKFWLPTWQWIFLIPLAILYFIVMFGDWQEWFNRRRDHWTLTSHRLILETPMDATDSASVKLSDIRKIRRWMWWTLVLRLSNGQATTMSFLRDPNTIRSQILTAQTKAIA